VWLCFGRPMATTNTRAGPSDGWVEMFNAAFARSQNAMAITDDHRQVIQVNGALAQLLGRRPSEIVGRHTWDFVVGGPLMSREQWTQAIARGDVTDVGEIQRGDGASVLVEFGIHPRVVSGRQLVLFVALKSALWGRQFRRPESGPIGELSNREREVLGMVALGETSPEIATALHISPNTVRKHVNSAMRKLGARSRAHLVAKALVDGSLPS
jgi:PAS domain S-box-containing protein